ncbi:DUF1569 domain-containing protein [Aquimarina sp. ERC-38]|uniref:DUF1569 domain-containing protein n=1 Tax=Aquimarina sp. ERC-38 TaxID=2949996 RepID=UPI0022482C0E|nr:DUF1569 domain-containing protein [Aquimarina sp. ERC-38]UZO80973.1 DUF1569 domain-containing protein [Aquimarina sp. ERC-38]
METLFDTTTKDTIQNRLANLHSGSQAKWGKMSVGQMLFHCQLPLEIATSDKHSKLKPNFIARLLFKKSLYNDRLWPKNLPTAPSLKVTSEKDFKTESTKLAEKIADFYSMKDQDSFKPHPVFGKFTPEQWGKMQYKHLDHHFRQFGV